MYCRPITKRHWTRDLAVSRDGKRLFVSIGSSTNVAPEMPKKTAQQIQVYEGAHGLGAAWGDEENRAVVRVFDPEGRNVRNFATGLRNCSGMTIQPGTDTLWCTGNERDHIGPNLVPDFLTAAPHRLRHGHLVTYLRLLDADEEGADWREVGAPAGASSWCRTESGKGNCIDRTRRSGQV